MDPSSVTITKYCKNHRKVALNGPYTTCQDCRERKKEAKEKKKLEKQQLQLETVQGLILEGIQIQEGLDDQDNIQVRYSLVLLVERPHH